MRPRRQRSGNFPNHPMTTHEQCWKVARETEEYGSGIHYTYDCSCQCYFFHPLLGALQTDWGVCTNPKSPRAGLLTFEHMGCAFYASPYHAGRNPTYHLASGPPGRQEASDEDGKPSGVGHDPIPSGAQPRGSSSGAPRPPGTGDA